MQFSFASCPRASRLALVAAAAFPLVASACVPAHVERPLSPPAPQASTQQAPQEAHLTVNEWRFTPNTLQLPAGQPVKLVLENTGQIDHDVTIPQLGVHLTAASGKTATQTVTASRDGTYQFECSIPGHKEAGMTGSAVVSASAATHADHPAASQADENAIAMAVAKAPQHISHASEATTNVQGNQPLQARMEGDVKVFDLTAQKIQWEVLPGELVEAYAYNGQVPGPLIRVTEGEKIRVNLHNELGEPTVIHFHGPTLPNSMDGVPDVTQKVVESGQSFTYEFEAKNPGTFMYHSHHNSAIQEGKGLYGLFIVDPKTPTLQADQDVVQVLSELGGFYLINGKSFPATTPIEAKLGQKVRIRLVNLGQMTHPMHMHGHPFKIVGTDGYPVPDGMELTKDVVNIGPGERYDLLMDAENPGTWVFHCHILTHVQNRGVEPGGMLSLVKITS